MTMFRSLVVGLFFVLAIMSASLPTAHAATSDANNLAGDWHLDELYDADNLAVALPAGDFIVSVTPNSNDNELGFALGLKVGNSLRTSFTVTGEQNSDLSFPIDVHPVMSTMMMPPQELFKLEVFLSNALPKMVTALLNEPTLILSGTEGKMVLSRA